MTTRKLAALLLILLVALAPVLPAQEAEKPDEIDIMKVTAADLRGADVRALVAEANRAYNEKRYEESAVAYIRALRADPGDSTALYNLACCYGLLGAEEKAAEFLLAAWDAGFRDLGHIRRDPDFDEVRDTKAFAVAMETLAKRSEEEAAARGDALMVVTKRLVPVRVVKPADAKPFERLPLVIGLHGLGDDAERFAALFRRREMAPRFLFAVPDAPYPFSRGDGVGYSWYLRGEETGTRDALLSHRLNVRYVLDVLEAVTASYRVDERKVFLMGFSQGAGMTLSVGLAHSDRFRGLVPIGGWLDVGEHSDAELASAAANTRILICHSPEDRAVGFDGAERAAELLAGAGVRNRLLRYAGGHSLPKELLEQVVTWIEEAE